MPEELPRVSEGEQLHLLLDNNQVCIALISTIRKKFETISWRRQQKGQILLTSINVGCESALQTQFSLTFGITFGDNPKIQSIFIQFIELQSSGVSIVTQSLIFQYNILQTISQTRKKKNNNQLLKTYCITFLSPVDEFGPLLFDLHEQHVLVPQDEQAHHGGQPPRQLGHHQPSEGPRAPGLEKQPSDRDRHCRSACQPQTLGSCWEPSPATLQREPRPLFKGGSHGGYFVNDSLSSS